MNLYVFDIDGVLTNTVLKRSNREVLSELKNKLDQGDFIAFNTGRSFRWVQERILNYLQEIADPSRLEKQFFMSCEMGNVTAVFNGKFWDKWTNPSTLMPQELITQVQNLTKKDFSESMFFDEKETMISVEVKDGFDEAEYLRQQKTLLQEIKELIGNDPYKKLGLKTGSNLIALDIKPENSGKELGSRRIMDHVENASSAPETVFCFGDNPSDFEMTVVFKKRYKTEFIFVGEDKEKMKKTSSAVKITFTSNLYDQGTLDYLRSN